MDEPRQDEEDGKWIEEAHERRKNHYRQWEEEEQAKRQHPKAMSSYAFRGSEVTIRNTPFIICIPSPKT